MSQQSITVSPKQLLVFLGIGAAIAAGAVVFFFKSSSQEEKTNPSSVNSSVENNSPAKSDGFLGEKGEIVQAANGKVYIDENQVSDGNMHAFNFFSEEENKTIYFFIVKASDGTYRAAANACEVCYQAKKGFSQVGEIIRCENCRVTYPKDKIALEKGGCNPGPIDKEVTVENGKLVLSVSDLEKVAYLF